MATINVERYRVNTDVSPIEGTNEYPKRTDSETIQAAVDKLSDGDTLVFNKKVETYDKDGNLVYDENGNLVYDTTYVLDKPIHLTSYKRYVDDEGNVTETGKTRNRITFNGNGCTIKNSPNFSKYTNSHVRAVRKEVNDEIVYENVSVDINLDTLFVTSDIMDNHLSNVCFKNFIFESVKITDDSYEHPDNGIEKDYPFRYTTAIGIGPSNPGNNWTYHYLHNSKISNCEFNYFHNGIELGGENNTIEDCKFTSCTTGVFCDCPDQAYIHHNHFFVSEWCGLNLTKSYRAFVCNNYFYHCMNFCIRASGPFAKEKDGKTMSLSVCSNTFVGGNVDRHTRNQTGIFFSGIKDAIIKDNFIYNMLYLAEKEEGNDGSADTSQWFGTGIWLDGASDDTLGYRSCERCIISGNDIAGCMRYSIRVNKSASCTVSGNSIHSGTNGAGEDYGIYIENKAGDLHISDNALYYFEEGKFMRLPDTNINAENNTYYNKNGKFDPLSPERYIRTHVSYMDPSTICIPKLSVPLDTGDEFEMLVPYDYSASIVTSITYEGLTGTVYNSGLPYLIPSTKAGTYIKLSYTYGQSANSGEKYIRFTVVE